MNIVRRVLTWLLLPVFSLSLFALPLQFAVLQIFGQPDELKNTIAESQIYDSLAPGILEQIEKVGGQGSEVPLDNPEIKAAAEKAFTPGFLQQSSETFISSIYRWLEGQTPQPDFQINLAAPRSIFAEQVGKIVEQKAAALPACPVNAPAQDFDAFNAACLPRSITPASAGAQAQNTLQTSDDFLKDPIITADSIKTDIKGPNGTTSVFADQLKDAPKTYQWAKKSPFIFASLAILVALAIVFLCSSKKAGLRRVGVMLIFSGLSLLAFAWLLDYGINKRALPEMNLKNQAFEERVRTLASDVTGKVDKVYWLFGGTYVAWGLAAIIGPSLLGHKDRGKTKRGELPTEQQNHSEPQEAHHPKPEHPVAPEPPAQPKRAPEKNQ